MEIQTKKMTSNEIKTLEEMLEWCNYLFNRIVAVVCIILALTFFMPTKMSSFFKFENGMASDLFLFEIDRLSFYFIICPCMIILYLIYAYLLTIPKINADLKHKIKEIGIIKVKEIKELSARDKKDLFGTVDYTMKFEKNSFKIKETYFLSYKQPELLEAKAFKVEVSKYAKVEFKREIVEI